MGDFYIFLRKYFAKSFVGAFEIASGVAAATGNLDPN
jgi:hypothetical protein